MFSRGDIGRLDAILHTPFFPTYPGMHHHLYPQLAFSPPDSEQLIRVTRARKAAGEDGLRFWACAEMTDTAWTYPAGSDSNAGLIAYLKGGLFRPLSETEFNDLVEAQCGDLIAPLQLPLRRGGFVGALALYTMDIEFIVSLFAEYEEEFIHFYWETAA